MTNVKDLAITELVDMVLFDPTTGDFWFSLEELQSWQLNQTENTSDVTGRNGRLITRLKRNKAVTVSGTHGLVSGGLYEAQTGSKFVDQTTKVQWTDYLIINNNEATTKYTAVGTAGAEIVALYIKDKDGITLGTELTQDSTAAAGKFAYAPATKKLTFNANDYADGTEIVVIYQRQIAAVVLDNSANKMSGKAIAYVNALAEDACHNVYRVQYYFPSLSFSGEFTNDLGGDQTTHNFTATAESDGCLGDSTYFTYTVFGVNAADA